MMPDREKVIYALKLCTRDAVDDDCICANCPYFVSVEYGCHRDQMEKDALVLLNEHEAVEPILIREGRNKNYNDYVCPRCDNEVVYEQNYCSECGVRFQWEGR